jgi:hypothetical protein
MNLAAALSIALVLASAALPPGWSAETFQQESTLEFYTVNSDGEGHWSTVWTVVIDGVPYIRLGSRAASRIDSNADAPFVKIRIAGQEFDHVLAQSAPEMADRVAAAMADKYWSDKLVRLVPHRLTMRLIPASAAAPAKP